MDIRHPMQICLLDVGALLSDSHGRPGIGNIRARLRLELLRALSLFLASSPSHSLAGLAWLSGNDPPTYK